MRFKTRKKLVLSVFCLIIAMLLTCQYSAIAAKKSSNNEQTTEEINSSKDIKENVIRSVMKAKVNSAKSRADNNIAGTEINLSNNLNIFPSSSKTNLILRDIDVATVLRVLAKEGCKNIVLDDSVEGIINADLRNVSLNEAMQTVLTSQELEYRLDNNTIFVASRPAMARKGLNRKFIKAFKLNNSNAVEVSKILEASIFNKGYTVAKGAAKVSAMQAVSMPPMIPGPYSPGMPSANPQPASPQAAFAPGETSTGQSNLINSKMIRGKVESMDSGTNFADSNKLASQIKIQNILPSIQNIEVNNNDGGAIVVPDTRTNSILVAGLQKDIELAGEALKYLDKPLQQVAIEVSLIELTKNDTNNLGLAQSNKTGYLQGGFNAIQGAAETVGMETEENTAGIMISSLRNMHDNVAIRLNALISQNKAKLLANPTVVALDGSESLVKITDQIVSRMVVTTEPMTGIVTYSPELCDIGIVLDILPKVSDNGYITMRIRPSITTFLKEVTFGSSGYANLISTREVILQSTRIKSGETLAIAGLIKDSDIKKMSKLPFAGDLPIFGPIFRNTTTDHIKSEVVILITPRVVNDIAYN